MKKIRLSRGAHPAPFDENNNATMCVEEYASYLAGEPHSDSPTCVSPVLAAFMRSFNDALDEETLQRLVPYAAKQLGTKGDGQDEVRSYMALDWLVRTHTPAFLAAAGLEEEADRLRGLAAIEGLEQAQAADPGVRAAWDAARAATRAAAGDAAGAATRAATRDAAWAATRATAGDAAWAATRAATRYAAWAATRATAGDAAWAAAATTAEAAGWDALHPIFEALQESAFELLDRMINPGGTSGEKRRATSVSEKTRLSEGEMLACLLGAKIDREEQPRSADDLVGQTWRRGEEGWELVEARNTGEGE